MKSLINAYIEHTKYGRGLIINEEADKITVEFNNQIGNKKFQFPDAFEQYLIFEDNSLQEESRLMIESKKRILAEEYEKRKLEEKKQEEDRLLQELEQKKKYKRSPKHKTAIRVDKTVENLDEPDELD